MQAKPSIEDLFFELHDDQAVERFAELPLGEQFRQESKSHIIRDGLVREHYWERRFARLYSVTYERITKQHNQRCNASLLLSQLRIEPGGGKNIWRGLLALLAEPREHLWTVNARTAIPLGDEFGVDRIHYYNYPQLAVSRMERGGTVAKPVLHRLHSPILEAWSVPFQQASIVRLR